jgi:penicillin amidase
MRFLRPGLAALILAILLVLGFRGAGPVPPIGPLLDPWRGVWAAASVANLPRRAIESIPGVTDTVRVVYDDRAVPHIFAQEELDAYRALGYVVARDRLLQLELQTRATAGTLTQLLGPAALEVDRSQRSLGLAWSAEREWAAADSASPMARAATAFAEGVNAWIDGLGPRDLPLEYQLLRARPMPWKPQYTLYLMKRMGYTLAFDTFERQRDRLATLIGEAAASVLFPVHSPIQQPIQPGPGGYARYDFRPLPPPAPPTLSMAAEGDGEGRSETERWEDVVGSNNWAVSPGRSATGHALLAGDPHLDLTLPSIWYEAHLVASGGLDVYGVTIPGVPGVVIGFNRNVAWSFTNTGSDVLDMYVEKLDNDASPTKYLLDGTWRPLERRLERYLGPKGEVLAQGTIFYTHRGPVAMTGDRPTSIRWLVLEAGAGDALLQAQRAQNVDQWLSAMEAFKTPAQNGVVADRAGTIAIRSSGAFPIRPGDGRGDLLKDGTASQTDWAGYWPLTRFPYARNPAQGYLVSANQEPKDPRVDPGYLGNNWPSPWRAIRINQLLRADSAVTVDAMRRYQTDPGSARADAFAPLLLGIATAAAAAGAAEAAELKQAVDLLAQWDRRYARDNPRAALFEYAMQELQSRVWDELLVPGPRAPRRVATPGDAVLLQALHDSAALWWDDRRTTDVVETRERVVAASLTAALERARAQLGDPATPDAWRWDRAQRANIHHLLRIPSFSALNLSVPSGPSTISPSSGDGTHSSSWRMVVELGPEVRGFGVYPGGQSGNPVSPRYQDRLPRWLSGDLDTLRFPRTAGDLAPTATLTLIPAGAR